MSREQFNPKQYPNVLMTKKMIDPTKEVGKHELLATSYRFQTKEFFDNSTLHGVRYIAEEGRPFCERYGEKYRIFDLFISSSSSEFRLK